MRGGARRGRAARDSSRATAAAVLVAACAAAGAGCKRDTALAPPDSFMIVAPAPPRDGAAARSKAGLPFVVKAELDDPRAMPMHQQFAVGFAGEVLRTDYLAKQLIREIDLGGRRYGEGPRAAAREPTVLIMGGARGDGPTSRGIAFKGSFGGEDDYPELLAVSVDAYPDHDRALQQTLAGKLGLLAASRVAAADAANPKHPLVIGYSRALEVVAREWRVGEGPAGSMPGDAGTAQQRELFAAVRENRYTLGPDGAPRAAADMLADPNVAATVIYRLAQSKTVGRKIAPDAVYAPFVKDRVPEGISPAAVLGPFRNFQAKLLSAWARAVLEGKPPGNIADLVDAYGRALPAERSDIVRIFVVTTFGATVKPGGVRPPPENPGAALPELTALAAEVAAGKMSSHAA
ncbi:MAG TPA: hypothetical protein VKQ32_21180, partial [Polyangia bacterium]|nr:hypothetical protein [Polyangia bacterium]